MTAEDVDIIAEAIADGVDEATKPLIARIEKLEELIAKLESVKRSDA